MPAFALIIPIVITLAISIPIIVHTTKYYSSTVKHSNTTLTMDIIDVVAFVLTGGLSMIPFAIDGAKDPDVPERTTNIRIAAGIDAGGGDDVMKYMGSVPGFSLFDIGGNLIGSSPVGEKLSPDINTFVDVSIVASSDIKDTQPEYLSVSAGYDAICISYITVTTSQDLKYTWVGDIGKMCNLPWYASYLVINSDGDTPACIWLNGDGPDGGSANQDFASKGMGMHIRDFSSSVPDSNRAAEYQASNALLCNSGPRFTMYPELDPTVMIPYFSPPVAYDQYDVDLNKAEILNSANWLTAAPPPPADPPYIFESSRRGLQQRSAKQKRSVYHNTTLHRTETMHPTKHHNTIMHQSKALQHNTTVLPGILIASTLPKHSALDLCDSHSSVGPDFVSHVENMYCDMANKRVYPLCVGTNTVSCFDVNTTSIVPVGLQSRGEEFPDKTYHKVVTW